MNVNDFHHLVQIVHCFKEENMIVDLKYFF